MTEVVLATRNPGKVREIRAILEAVPGLSPVGLDALGIPETAEEDGLETAPTFAENALAKARYFAARTGRIVLADDSGLAVDALDGAPGVHSRRFAGADRLRGRGQDEANIQLLLERLDAVPDAGRTARFVCVMAVVAPDGREATFEGAVEGTILRAPRGEGGFGYDPVFLVPAEGRTMAELPAARKNARSHRGIAARKAAEWLSQVDADGPPR